MKSLRIIQILVKIVRIICIVLFVLFIVGAAGCALSLIILPIIQNIEVSEGKTIADLMVEKGVVISTMYGSIVIGLLSCGVGIFLAHVNRLFFEEELKVETPFDKDIVKKMRVNALINIIASIALSITAGIVVGIVKAVSGNNTEFRFELLSTVGYGLFLLVLSLFCDYGAELKNPPVEVIDSSEENEAE